MSDRSFNPRNMVFQVGVDDCHKEIAKLDQASDEPCDRCGGSKRWAVSTGSAGDGLDYDIPCPDCTEDERHA